MLPFSKMKFFNKFSDFNFRFLVIVFNYICELVDILFNVLQNVTKH